jgi:hypothetical protein
MMIPIGEEIARLDSPEAIADRRLRAKKVREDLPYDQYWQLVHRAGVKALGEALSVHKTFEHRQTQVRLELDKATIEKQRKQNLDRLVEREIEANLRHSDESAIYSHPDRQEEQRIWSAYLNYVSSIAWRQGNKSESWVTRWQRLVHDRAAAEAYGDATGSIDRQLEQLVGIPFPVLPDNAWDTADCLSETERETEYKRLEKKYGPRKPEGAARFHRGRNQPK